MKTWKQGIFGILAIIAFTFTACDDGNGKDKKDPCPCTVKVHYDTPCDCVGVGNDCDCTVYYKPAFANMFAYLNGDDSQKTQTENAYNTIWASNPQLLVRLESAVGVKESPLAISYSGSVFGIEFVSSAGRVRISGDIISVNFAEFTTAFETAIQDAVEYYESQ